jgi:hypothetical protein
MRLWYSVARRQAQVVGQLNAHREPLHIITLHPVALPDMLR